LEKKIHGPDTGYPTTHGHAGTHRNPAVDDGISQVQEGIIQPVKITFSKK
jgi:hypothetical protein